MFDTNNSVLGFNLEAATVVDPAADLAIEEVCAGDLFGMPSLRGLMVERRLPHNLPVARIDRNFLFRAEILKPILSWLHQPGGDAFFISGPMGASKTSTLVQVLARLNWPSMVLSWGKDSEFDTHLVASVEAANGTTFVKMLPLPVCMHYGIVLIINEIDAGEPGRLTPAFDILEGGNLTIPQTNQIVRPHPDFRIAVTANTNGTGDPTGLYRARKVMDAAFMDRFRGVNIGYPSQTEEFQIIDTRFPHLGRPLVEKMTKYAAETRRMSLVDTDGISIPLSVRTLCRIGEIMTDYGVAVDDEAIMKEFTAELLRSFELGYWFRLEEADQKAARSLFKGVFGLDF